MASSELRLDPLTGRWVVVSASRAARPSAFRPLSVGPQSEGGRACPFCPDSELVQKVSLELSGPEGDWVVRVLANRYPAFAGEEPLVVENGGPVFSHAPASGTHEVLVLSPHHRDHWGSLSDDKVDLVMNAIAKRLAHDSEQRGLRYTQVIVNAGRDAGASIDHPHGQLLGMPFVPRELVDEQAGFGRFAGNCLLCATISAEEGLGHRIVEASDDALVITPFWSGTPFEMLVLPRSHEGHMHRSPEGAAHAVGRALRDAVCLLEKTVGKVAYNLVFHSAPYRTSGTYHWHVHIWPKLTTLAGFELGTGVLINVVAPEAAASALRTAG